MRTQWSLIETRAASGTQKVAPGIGFCFCFVLFYFVFRGKLSLCNLGQVLDLLLPQFLECQATMLSLSTFFFLFHTGNGSQGHVILTVAEDNIEKVSNTFKITDFIGVKAGFEPR